MQNVTWEEVRIELIRMIHKQKGKGTDTGEFRATVLEKAYNCVVGFTERQRYGDCNTCDLKGRCKYEVGIGCEVRTNCPFYRGSELWEPPKAKAKNAMRMIDPEEDDGK